MSNDHRAGCRAKIERAEENIRNLNTEIADFFAADPRPHRIVRQYDSQLITYRWKVFEDVDLPPRFAVMIGEVIHHLRSSLDLLLCALVRERGNNVTTQHGFPVCLTPEKFKAQVNGRAIEGISRASHNLIEGVQPYNTGQPAENSLLAILHDLDVEDKHKLLVVVSAATVMNEVAMHVRGADPALPEGVEDRITSQAIISGTRRVPKEGIEMLSLTFDRERINLDPEAQFSSFVAFEKFGPVELQPVIPALVQSADYVRYVVGKF